MQILVADDDLATVRMTAFLLQEAGYRVLKASDGPTILHMVAHHQPDLVLLDVSMPKTTGVDICRLIRRTSDVPIIFLSGRSALQDKVMGLQLGGDDYLVKPFEPVELLARVEAVLRRHTRDTVSSSAYLRLGDLTLNPIEQKVVFADDRSVELTSIEFRLLYYLMHNSGRVLSTRQILSKVWGYDDAAESNLVAVYIRRLRAKLAAEGAAPHYISTVRNLGYKFEA